MCPKKKKIQRAVYELITLKTKVCRPVSRRLSVIEQGDPLWNSLIHQFQTSEKFRTTAQKMSKSGFFWNAKESIKETNDFDEINNFFIQNYWNKNRDLREAHLKSLNEMEELKRFQGSTFDRIARRKLVEDRDTILELTGKWTIPRYQSTTVIPTSSNS